MAAMCSRSILKYTYFKHVRNTVRTLCYPSIPLNQPIGDFRNSSGNPNTVNHSNKTLVTTLDCGLRVASQESFGQYSTVGVFVDAGSRHEAGYPPGLTHLLSKLSFMGSSGFPTFNDINAELEKYGGVPDVKAFRDLMFYNISCYAFALPQAMELLSDVFWRPHISEDMLETGKCSAVAEFEDMGNLPVPESILMDLAHQSAYRGNTLGLPGLCTSESVNEATISDIGSFLATYFVPSRLVVVGANVNHSELVQLAEKHFVNQATSWKTFSQCPIDTSAPVYTGGMVKVSRLGAPVVGPNRLPDLTHIIVSLESSSYKQDDFYTFAVLNSLMGGGGSFSAGGPGKGMYTQLYLRVLNKYHWVYHAQAINHAYSDSGIFCLFGSTHPQKSRHLVDVLCKEFHNIAGTFDAAAIARAKKMLQSALLMNLESRAIMFEDIGRQVLGHNKRHTAQWLCEKIDAVTSHDIQRIGEKMCSNSLSVAALGDLSELPELKEIQTAFESKQGLTNTFKSSFFRL